jgi:ATP-dependent exoDNAse (exonuclease V) beta subunit
MFTLYKASAGSGKTSRLVVEYLSLCLPCPEKFKNILAITFTNNATAEMKSRIVDTLSLLAFEPPNHDNHTYNQIVAHIAAHLSEAECHSYLSNQAKKLLKNILYEYDRFSISTIDSFFQRILRAFAVEFGLNTQFNLEIEKDEFFKEAISVLIQRISMNNKELTDRVMNLVEYQMMDKGRWKMEIDLMKLLEMSMEEQFYIPLKKLQESDYHNFNQAKKKISQEKKRLKSLIKNYSPKPKKNSAEYKTYMMLEKQLEELNFFGRNLFQLALLFDLRMIMSEIKSQDNRFFISETNAFIHEKISTEDDVPFIYEKIGNQYSYFFLDEFQDTSKLQWENMIPLIKNALSGNNKFNEVGQAFLFGDVKQAIYRFRNGDADILQQLSKIEGYKDTVLPYATPDQDYRVKLLNTNYRSSKKVIEFNNEFFDFLSKDNINFEKAKEIYEDVKQKAHSKNEGMVTVCFQADEDDRKFEDFVMEPIIETIENVFDRGFEYKDIAVLVSSNKLASKVGEQFIEKQIPIISAQSLQLSASPQINVVISTLQYLISNEDKLAKLAIVHYLTQQNNLLLEDYIPNVQNETLFKQFLSGLNMVMDRKQLAALPLYRLIHEIYHIFAFQVSNPFLMRFLDEAESFATRFNGNIALFLEWWEEKGKKASLSTPQGMEAVTVSTVHKSKGLEYPIVIFPFSNYKNDKTKPDVFIHDDEQVTGLVFDWVTLTNDKTPERFQYENEEETKKTQIDQLNKLYVAHTRAGKELHIITAKKNRMRGNYSKFLTEFIENSDDKMIRRLDEETMNTHKAHRTPHTALRSPYTAHCTTYTAHCTPYTEHRTPHTEYGIFVHHFLSSVTTFPQNEKEIECLVQNVEERHREKLTAVFSKILNDSSLAPLFAPDIKVLNENSILFPNGNVLRPDRVVFCEDKVVVIDYKTGEANASHKEQIEQYCDAIRKMGYEKVEGRVLYV